MGKDTDKNSKVKTKTSKVASTSKKSSKDTSKKYLKEKPELVGKVYDKNDLILGTVSIFPKSKKFQFDSKDGKLSLQADTLPELTDSVMKDRVKWMYIRYRRDKVFDIRKFTKPSKDKKPCWRSDSL